MKFTIAIVVLALAVTAQASIIGLPYALAHDDGQWDHDVFCHDGSYHRDIFGHNANLIAGHYAPAVIAAPHSAHIVAAAHPAIVAGHGAHIVAAATHSGHHVVPHLHAHEG